MSREAKVGGLLLIALVVFAGGIFLVGDRNNLFARKNNYFIQFENVSGLSAGSPVQLNGVNVGNVERVVLPEDVDEKLLTIWISMDSRYEMRVRQDSTARIKTLGLLGDKYIEISSGSAELPAVTVDGEISAAPATDVDRLLSSGEDAVDNVVAISYSLRTILDRIEEGEGLLGELLTESESSNRVKDSIVSTVDNLERITARLDRGEGTLGTLLRDDQLANRLKNATVHLDEILARLDAGEGALGGLLTEPQMAEDVSATISSLRAAAAGAEEVVGNLQSEEGLLQKFLRDEAYAKEVSDNFRNLVENLSRVSDKIESGQGSLSQVINDPQLYEALDDIVVGINESKLLRWLIRNRQKTGIKKRYKEETEAADAEQAAPGQ